MYLTAADSTGMMASIIQSNYWGFGSGVVVPGTGISLQNRGADFVATPGRPHQVGPNKRPYHTIIPGFVTKDGTPVMSFGVMGGTMQSPGACAGAGAHRRLRPGPADSLRWPRFRWIQGMQISCETGFPAATLSELWRRGHQLTVDDYHQFGSWQAMWRLDDGYLAASDPRQDGQAAGL